jgi:hypothetical protein
LPSPAPITFGLNGELMSALMPSNLAQHQT